MNRLSRRSALPLLGGLAIVSMLLALAFGAGHLAFARVWSGGGFSAEESAILFDLRLPRVLLAAVLGGALTVAGVVFQALLRNPLADPYVLGVSGGASLGGVLAVVCGLGSAMLGGWGLSGFAFLGALGALVAIERAATVDGRLTVYTLLLTGVVCNAFTGAVIVFLQSLASFEELHSLIFYLLGQVPSLTLPRVGWIAAAVLLAVAALWVSAREFNVLALGEEQALQLGVDVERLKRRTYVLGSLLTALAVSVAGLIGFVGLIVPHLLRLLLGPDHRLLVPAAFLGGASFLVLCDLLARTLAAPTEIPVGVLTALVGGPFFLYLLRSRSPRNGQS